jgi:hypothetical protein
MQALLHKNKKTPTLSIEKGIAEGFCGAFYPQYKE